MSILTRLLNDMLLKGSVTRGGVLTQRVKDRFLRYPLQRGSYYMTSWKKGICKMAVIIL